MRLPAGRRHAFGKRVFLALFFLSDSLFFFFSGSPGSRGLRSPRTALDLRRSALRAGVDLEIADQGLDGKKKKTLRQVTSGVVSRCETTSYVHSGTGSELLAVQIDAAVNAGGLSRGLPPRGGGEAAAAAAAASRSGRRVSVFFPFDEKNSREQKLTSKRFQRQQRPKKNQATPAVPSSTGEGSASAWRFSRWPVPAKPRG